MIACAAAPLPRDPAWRALDDALAPLGCGDTASALDALEQLEHDFRDWDEPVFRRADILRRQGNPLAAMVAYAEVLHRNPGRAEALLALGATHLAVGDAQRALPFVQRCCELMPANAQARHAYGLAHHLLGQNDVAYTALAIAHRLDASNTLCAVHLSDVGAALGQISDVIAWFAEELRANPASAALLTAQAAALAHAGQHRAALDHLEAATLVDPQDGVAVAMFADHLARSSRQAEAELALRDALRLDPRNADASMALSVVLMRLHRHVEAVELLRQLQRDGVPPLAPLCNLATALMALGQQDAAIAAARDAIGLAPHQPAAHRALCNALPYHPHVTGGGMLEAAQAAAALPRRASLPVPQTHRDPERRLRVGIVSGTLRAHPVGWLTLAGFEHLDRAAFDLICFAPHLPEDSIGRRFAATASAWDDIAGLDDVALAERARALKLDIAIDLGGYGDMGRMAAFAHRLAPVQIKWVGMQNHSTGLAEMDWFISDRWETPPTHAPFYSERLLVMQDGYVCYTPPNAPDVSPPPSLLGAPFTFGCFNNLAKITPDVIALWSHVLQAVPAARLLLKAHQFNNTETKARVRSAFADASVSPARIDLRGSSHHRELLRQYADVDVVLDPFPYSGGLTTCEALWMGVPTLTMPGETFASRHSASHMSNVGLADWVVADAAAYLRQAISRAADVGALAALRAGLRDRVRTSPLGDAPRFGASLGAGLRTAWRHYCGTA